MLHVLKTSVGVSRRSSAGRAFSMRLCHPHEKGHKEERVRDQRFREPRYSEVWITLQEVREILSCKGAKRRTAGAR